MVNLVCDQQLQRLCTCTHIKILTPCNLNTLLNMQQKQRRHWCIQSSLSRSSSCQSSLAATAMPQLLNPCSCRQLHTQYIRFCSENSRSISSHPPVSRVRHCIHVLAWGVQPHLSLGVPPDSTACFQIAAISMLQSSISCVGC